MSKNSQLLEDILERLNKDEPFFRDFSFKKKCSRLINKNCDSLQIVEFQYWVGFDLDTGTEAFVVKPLYLKRFNTLHEWFEKFSLKSLSDQRDAYSVGFDGGMLGRSSEFKFSLSLTKIDEQYNLFRADVFENASFVFNKFSTLKNLYEYLIPPVLDGTKRLPMVGAEYLFWYLKLASEIDQKGYDLLKPIVLNHIELLYSNQEPNVSIYYPKVEGIIKFIEQKC